MNNSPNTPSLETTENSLSAGYSTLLDGSFDEMWSRDNNGTREHWQQLLALLNQQGGNELTRAAMEARRLFRENGVTYNVFSEPDAPTKNWELDTVPLLVNQREWDMLEVSLAQRAKLFNLMVQDLYGERRLIKEGLIPPELIYGNPNFLRQCDKLPLAGNPLLFFASDLSRGPDGQHWVIADRTQAPSGAGYALENRIVMTRLFPDIFRQIQVHRLSVFFRTVRETLAKLTPNREDPRIVVLTPGPESDTYFEHAYLASYLGYYIVRGNDLTVKDGKVWLKSIEGLKQVDIIIRRLDDDLCDPLELREDSKFGIPGILQAVREKNVVIANAPGVSVLESPGLLPFLPNIAKALLGENLKLPSVATWWCGQEREMRYVLDHLETLVIKSVSGQHRKIICRELSQAQLSELREKIKTAPYLYVGQEELSFSTTPCLIDKKLQPRHATMRSFLVASDDSYVAMPGGLTRISRDADGPLISRRAGGLNKDTWILTDESTKRLRVWPQTVPTRRFEEQEGILPSRAAENLFWVGRYIERSESTARLLRTVIVNLNETDDHGDDSSKYCLHILLQALTTMTGTLPGFVGEDKHERLTRPYIELKSLIVDDKRSGSMAQALQDFVRAAFGVRDLWSNDTWRTIDDIDEELNKLHAAPISLNLLYNRLDEIISYIMAFIGLTSESMSHDNGWHLLDIGRRIERALMQISLMRFCLCEAKESAVEHLLIDALLTTQESLIAHGRRFREFQRLATAVELLLLDPTNPRSLAYQVYRIDQFVNRLPRTNKPHHLNEEQRICLAATTHIRLAAAEKLMLTKSKRRPHLEKFLNEIEQYILSLSSALQHTYFSHTESAQQLTSMRVEIAP